MKRLPDLPRPPHPRQLRAFTLVELIGVLSILTLLTTFAVSTALGRLRRAEQLAEAATLQTLARAFDKVVLDRRLLPGSNDWIALLAPEIDGPSSRLATTRGGCRRLLFYDPASPIRPAGTARLQTASGFPPGTNACDRALLLSTLSSFGFPSHLNLDAPASFSALWNVRPNERPTGWSPHDLPDPSDLQIVRVDLGRLLHRVSFNNMNPTGVGITFSSAHDGTLHTVADTVPRMPWQARFLHGTTLDLLHSNNAMPTRESILSDRTFYIGDGTWGTPQYPVNPNVVKALVADFLAADFPGASNQQRPRAALDELYRSLWSYMKWEEGGFLEGGNNKKQAPDAYVVRSTVARLNQGTLNLIGSGGGGGGGGKKDK